MEIEDIEISDIIKIIKKRKLTFIVLILASVGITGLFLSQMEPRYQATAKVLIESPPNKKISIQDMLVQDSGSDQYLNTQYSLFKSRTLIRKLIKELHLESSEEFQDKSSFNIFTSIKYWIKNALTKLRIIQEIQTEESKTDPYSLLIDKILNRLDVDPEKNSKIVNIKFEGFSPVLIAKITNSLVDLYIRDHMEYQKTLEAGAEKWLNLKGDELNKRVKSYTLEIQDFKQKQNMIELDGKRDFANQQYSETLAQIAIIRTKISKQKSLIQQLNELKSTPKKMFYSLPESLKDETITKLRDSFIEEKIKWDNLSKVLKPSHPDLKNISKKIEAIEARIPGEMERLLKSMEADYQATLNQEEDLKILQNKQKEILLSLDNKTVQLNQMKQEAEASKNLLEQMLTRGKELEVFSSYYFPPIRIVDRAEVPRKPVKPRVGMTLALALSFSLFGGLVLVFFRESLDHSLNNEGDVKRKLPFPLLGSISKFSKAGLFISPKDNNEILAEEFSFLRTRILRQITLAPIKSFLVTSASPEEGKATVASNLAISLAKAGKKVLIIDSDLVKPTIHEIFKVENDPGLIDGLSNSKNILKDLIKSTSYPRIWVIPAGSYSEDSTISADALFTSGYHPFLKSLEQLFDVILVKAPPVLSLSHACILEEFCDGILFVIAAGNNDKHTVQKAVDLLISSSVETETNGYSILDEGKINNNGFQGESISKPKFFSIVLNKVNDPKRQPFSYSQYKKKQYGNFSTSVISN